MSLYVVRGMTEVVEPGSILTDFRGERWVLVAASRETMPGKSGKVLVDPVERGMRREFYVTVFGHDLAVFAREAS